MVIPGSGRVGWQEKFKTIVGAPIRKRHAGKQHNAIQINLMALLQNARQLRRTRCAVALANQILRRSPALVTRDVLINEVCEPVRVLDDAVELRWALSRRRTAVARRDGIDEDEIGGIQKRIFVVDY